MNTERINKLTETKSKLKKEFVGLDGIIDKVIDSITPWYLTPEMLERPTVVSLWGLTGTGKTSLVRRLVYHLEISDKTLFFDCGEQGGDDDMKLFSDKLDSLFESSQVQESDIRFNPSELEELGLKAEGPKMTPKMDPLDYTFVFDEFQYLHTKDPGSGAEETRPEGRAIWGLLDSGIVDINKYDYRVKSMTEYMEDIEVFSEEHPGITLKDGRFDKKINPLLKQQLSYYRWGYDGEDMDEDEEKSESPKGYKVLQDDDSSFLFRRLNILKRGLGYEVLEKVCKLKTLQEFIEYIKGYINLLSKPKVINCSRSLIFVLGNLDEAFDLTGEDLDPDIDADIYHEITSKVNCMDIKTALRQRFRDEQVGRLGNNIIVYPSLRRKDFEEIINRELTRISGKFKKTSGKEIRYSEKFKRLVYSEGCFPIQGVRPIFSTINTFVSPLLSLIIVSDTTLGMYLLDVKEDNFNSPEITLQVSGEDGEIMGTKKISLNLGALRSPERCKKIGLQSVHEASHAVLYYIMTGKYPSAIVASNVFGDGGYMMNAISTDSSTESVRDLKNDVIVSLAGYYGEREFFDPDMCSLGASSDISTVWTRLRGAFYDSGLKIPMRFSEPGVSLENEGRPFGFPETKEEGITHDLMGYFKSLCEETKKLIHQERKTIRKVALELCKKRSLGIDTFKEIIKENISGRINESQEDYYLNTLKNEEKSNRDNQTGDNELRGSGLD